MSVFFTRRGKAPQRVNYVEYLVSNGTQYILLNYKPNQNTRIVCDCQADSLDIGGSYLGQEQVTENVRLMSH